MAAADTQLQHYPGPSTGIPGYPFPYPPGPPVFPGYFPYAPTPWVSPMPSGSHPRNIMSSSPPGIQEDDISVFPLLVDWLKGLDEGPRGVDNCNFAQYTQRFIEEEFLRVCDITDLSAKEIIQICPGMMTGTALKIVKYAQQDTAAIKKQQKHTQVMRM